MGMIKKQEFSRDTWIGVVGALSGIGSAVMELNWLVRSFLVLLAVGLICYAAVNNPAPRGLRIAGSAVLSLLFVGLAWKPIWNDFSAQKSTSVESSAVTKDDLKPLIETPRIVVSNVEPLFFTPSDVIRFNVHYINLGQTQVRNVQIGFAYATTKGGVLDLNGEDNIFQQLSLNLSPSKGSTDLMEPTEARFSTFPPELNSQVGLHKSDFEALQKAGGSLYVFAELRYLDTRDGDLWKTRLCEYWSFNTPPEYWLHLAAHKCIGHNGVFRMDK
jgi:hypothetical protein